MQITKTIKKCLILCLPLAALGLISCVPPRLTTEGIDSIQMAAHRGDSKSQVIIGEIYEFGAGVPADSLIAAQWYQLAAKRSDPQAQFYLGIMYETGVALKQSPFEALKWLFKSGEQGHEKAQILLAVLYLKDKDLRQEFTRRIKAYRQQAEKGDAGAQYTLGWIYMEGAGLPVNPREALKWYSKAVEKGHAKAQLALGDIYLNGKAAQASPREALKWYQKSAQADIKARIKLCELYKGAGRIPEDTDAAKQCLEAANRSTDTSLRSYIDTQYAILNSEKEKHPVMALRACQRIFELDPAYGKVSDTCNALNKQISGRINSQLQEAQAALEQKDMERFSNLFDRLLTPDFNGRQFRPLITGAWQVTEEENLATEKMAQEQLRLLEAAARTVSHRSGNVSQINKIIAAFRGTISQGLRDNPEDVELTALLRKGNRIIAGIQQKLKTPAPPPVQDKIMAEPSEEPSEEADPGEDSYTKAQELFSSGRFGEAEALFEKTTRTRGSRYIASSYIYLGISHLARINPSNVNEARKRQLKGLACFQNALRFDRGIALPAGYDKYQPVFNKAKEQLR